MRRARSWRRRRLLERGEDLLKQRSLALVLEVVDRERGHDAVESTQVGKRLGEVVVQQFDRLVGEARAGALEHRDAHAPVAASDHDGRSRLLAED